MEGIDLSFFLKTKADAQDFSARVNTIIERVFSTSFNLEQVLLDEFGITKKDKFLQMLRDNNVSVGSPTAVKAFLQQVLVHVSKMPVLSVCLPIEPKEQTLKILSEWFVLNIKRQMLLDITVDPSLIAGLTIDFQGKHLDYSIKPQFETMYHALLTPPSASVAHPFPPPGAQIPQPVPAPQPLSVAHQNVPTNQVT